MTTQIDNTSTIETGITITLNFFYHISKYRVNLYLLHICRNVIAKIERSDNNEKSSFMDKGENRKPIFLNELNHPIGPDENTLSEFSSFLGTLAQNGTLAPLAEANWRVMPMKEALWEYVQVNNIFFFLLSNFFS